MYKIWVYLIIFIVIFYSPGVVYAKFEFTVPQTSLDAAQEIETDINLSLQNSSNKTYYLEGAFKPESGSHYFGLTWNDSDWTPYTTISGNYDSLKQIQTNEEGSWSGKLKIKLDIDNEYFSGNGNYLLKIIRFTQGGSTTSSDNDFTTTVINAPTQTPTNTPIPANTPTLTPTKSPTSTTKPTNKPTLKPTSKPTATITEESTTNLPASILGTSSAQLTTTPTSSPKVESSVFSLQSLFTVSGVLILILSGILYYTFVANKKVPKL